MDDGPLAVWAVATFNVAALAAALVGALYLDGRLGYVLADLNTGPGVALYVCLWATTWWTNRRCLAGLDGDEGAVDVFVAGGTWGAVNGALFFWAVFALAVAPALGLRVEAVALALLALGVGTALAACIGGVVGIALAAVDAAAFRVAARIAPESGG